MELISGYGTPYDPLPVIEKIDEDRAGAMSELWENLYHQGDVGSASYAAVPKLVSHGELALVAAIEVARQEEGNPEVPVELMPEYKQALQTAMSSSPRTEEQYQGYYVIHASVSGQHRLAKALNLLCVEEIISEYG